MSPSTERALAEDAAAYAGDWVAYRQKTLRIPGVAVAIAKDGELLHSGAYGHADVENDVALTTDHAFRIASHSKTFTATAVLQLVEQGRLRLDDRAADWLDWLPAGDGQLGDARVRDLLSHAGGLTRDGLDAPHWQLREPFPDEALFRERLEGWPLVLPGIERFKYSNIGYTLLGLIVGAAAGSPYDTYVRANVLEPLGLQATGVDLDDDAAARLATGYSSRRYGMERFPIPHLSTGVMAAATGFWATAEDVCRYGAAHCFGDDRLLTGRSKRDMQHEHWKVAGRAGHYGLGFGVNRIDGRKVVGHGGGFPGFITYTWIDPATRLVVTVLTNAIDGPAEALATGVIRIFNLAEGRLRTAAAPPPAHAAGVDLGRFGGRFFSLWGAIDIVRLGDRLVELDPEAVDPVALVAELTAEDEATLRIADAPGYASPGEAVRYQRNDDGTVRRVDFAGAHLYPWEGVEEGLIAPARRRCP